MVHRILTLLLTCGGFAALVGVAVGAAPGPEPRYVGALSDGTAVSGNMLRDETESPGDAKLDLQPLWSIEKPLRWLRDTKLPDAPPAKSYVEMRNGDVLPGTIVRMHAAEEKDNANYLLVGSATPVAWTFSTRVTTGRNQTPPQAVRVDLAEVARVAWQARPNQAFTPNTAFYKDGRTVAFRSLHWLEKGIKVLKDDGPVQINFDELAELHLAPRDVWGAYFDQAAQLTPDLNGRLVQYEMLEGLRVTADSVRFQLPVFSVAADYRDTNRWLTVVQPVWSLDPLWLELSKIRLRRYFGPLEVSLSTLVPVNVRQSTGLAASWRPQFGRNVQGGPLRSGGMEYGWGFGVHAFNQLDFDLPSYVAAVRVRIGLDQVTGQGGCARGMVVWNGAVDVPLYASPILVGSSKTADSGRIAIPANTGVGIERRRLSLVADPVLYERPANADPLEIGDMLDWLEPVLELDPAAVQAEIAKRLAAKKDKQDGEREAVVVHPPALAKIAPDFVLAHPALQVQVKEEAAGQQSLYIAPLEGGLPQIFRRTIEVPVGKQTRLFLTAMHRDSYGCNLIVLANGKKLIDSNLADDNRGKRVPLTIDLTPFAGRKVALEIDLNMTTLVKAGTYFSRVEIVSEDPPPAMAPGEKVGDK